MLKKVKTYINQNCYSQKHADFYKRILFNIIHMHNNIIMTTYLHFYSPALTCTYMLQAITRRTGARARVLRSG